MGEPDYPASARRLYELCTTLLYGPDTWLDACRAAAYGGPADVADLCARLEPGHEVARAGPGAAMHRGYPAGIG
jgi:hypothetical protein